jgi:Kef-type K+ transport system membrane component KefB
MDAYLFYILLAKIALSIGTIAMALCLFVPRALQHYKAWRSKGKTLDFSAFVLFSFISFSLISVVYLAAIRESLKIEDYFSVGYERAVFFIMIILFLVYFLIPQTLKTFLKWRSSHISYHFSLSIFWGVCCVYLLSVLYLLSIPYALR